MTRELPGLKLYCSHTTCRSPVVRLADNAIIIWGRHHGEWHESALDLATKDEAGWPNQKDVLPVNMLGEVLRR